VVGEVRRPGRQCRGVRRVRHGRGTTASAREGSFRRVLIGLSKKVVRIAGRIEGMDARCNLQAAFEIENMNWTEVMQSDDAQLALSSFLAVDPASRRDWFESASSKSYRAYSGH
jgi:hypothetical protein